MLEKIFDTVNKKITGAFFLVALITGIGLGVISMIGFFEIRSSARELAKLKINFVETYYSLKLKAVMISHNEEEYESHRSNKYLNDINDTIEVMAKDIGVVKKEKSSRDDKKSVEAIDEMLDSLNNYKMAVISLINMKNNDKFKKFTAKKEYLDGQVNLINDSLDKLINIENNDVRKTIDRLNILPGFMNRIIALFFVILFIGILFGSRVASKKFIIPLEHLVDISKSASEGNLTKKVPSIPPGELGVILKSFNKMVERLRSLIGRVKDTSKDVSTVSSDLLNISRIQANNSADQSTSILDTAGLVRDLDEISGEIARKTEFVTRVIENTLESVQGGQAVIENIAASMGEVKSRTELMTERISDLNIQSKEISSVIGIIDDIAEQTDLLALNAAIEAARAGEAGKGFAVVASEIRNLAEEVVKSTLKIKNIMTMIQKSSSSVTQSSEENIREIEENVSIIKSSGEGFSKVLESVEQITGVVQEISVMTNRQKLSSNQALNAIQLVAEHSKEFTASFDRTSLSAEKLNKLIGNLNKEVEVFVLEEAVKS